MGSKYKKEKKKIKERYDDPVHSEIENDHGVHQDHDLLGERKERRKFLHFERENELNERHKSLSLNSYQKSKNKCTTFKSSLKRFVIILVIIGAICGSVYIISNLLAKRRMKNFRLQGNDTHFVIFEGINKVKFPSNELKSIHLQNVQLTPWDFLEAIQDCTFIQSIILQNIRITNGEFNETIYLPALKDFFYDEVTSTADENMKGIGSKITMPEQKLKSILFFRNKETKKRGQSQRIDNNMDNLDLTLIWTMKVNINITLDGTTVIVTNHTTGELVLPWLNYLKREEIIQNAGKDLRRLHCNRLKVSIDSLPSKLTHLTLRDVKLVGGNFTTLLTRFSKLVDMRISFPDLTCLDLADLPRKTLRNLALSKFNLFNSVPGVKFKLEGLTLISTNLSLNVVEDFSTVFQVNDGDLAVSEYTIEVQQQLNNGNKSDYVKEVNQILLKQLLQQTQAERIIVYKYRGATGTLGPIVNGTLTDTNNFILERRQRNDQESLWYVNALDWINWHGFKHQAMGLDKFWAHAGTIY